MWFVPYCLTVALYLVVKWIFIMNLAIYDAQIIHYHMNPLQLVALDQSDFMHLALSGHLLLGPGHLALSNHYYSSGGKNK